MKGVKNSPLVINANHIDAFSQGGVVHQSLKYLCPQNADLIKLLLRDCQKAQYTEKELLQLELQRNMDGNRLLDCYGFANFTIYIRINLYCITAFCELKQTPCQCSR